MSGRVEHIGSATLYLGDCREILPTLGKVDAVVTDPPYGKALRNNNSNGADKRTKRDYAIRGDADMSLGIEVLQHLANIPIVAAFASPAKPWPGRWNSYLVWDKGGAVGGGGHVRRCWKQTWELIQVRADLDLQGGRDVAVLQHKVAPWQSPDHPAQEPVGLLAYIIEKVSTPGQRVLDPFMGSGSAGVACMRLGREFVGIELDEVHFNTACRRLEEIERQGTLFSDAAA